MTTVINLYGGPGSGKSTCAASVFSRLKNKGINAELVTEFAKELVWGESMKTLNNQIYIFGKQHNRLWRLLDQVEVIVTDSPLLLSCIYGNPSETFDKLVFEEFNKMDNINVFLSRVKEYNPKGRYQTLEEARELDIKILDMLSKVKKYSIASGNETGVEFIMQEYENKRKMG